MVKILYIKFLKIVPLYISNVQYPECLSEHPNLNQLPPLHVDLPEMKVMLLEEQRMG